MSNLYDIAQICLNGHVVNAAKGLTPHHSQGFCSRCGVETIVNCRECSRPIRGALLRVDDRGHASMVGGLQRDGTPPAFCAECGKPFPWTRASLDAARELAMELLDLTPEERETMSQSLPDLISDNPHTAVAATRFKRVMNKAGAEAGSAFSKILTGVLTEAAKKILFP